MEKNRYYNLLGISADATQKEIEAAYHRKQPYWDFFDPATDFEDDPEAKELYEAYAVLSDEEKRSEYDEIQRTHIRTMQDLSDDAVRSMRSSRSFRKTERAIETFSEHPLQFILGLIIILILVSMSNYS